MATAPLPYLTPEQYLEIEEKAEFKSEYWDGQMYAMAGGTPRHSEVGTLFAAAAVPRLKRTGCGVFNSDLRIRDSERSLYTYPDVSIVCGKPEYGEKNTLSNPTVLVEVLSPATEAKDRGAKFQRYRQIESLKEYVLISQDEPWVETYLRQMDGSWRFESFNGLAASVELKSVGIEIPLAEIYDGITFRDWFTT
jgi:Uma2 family endonuclease